MAKKITLESLATMIATEFTSFRKEVKEEFASVRRGIEEINIRLEKYYHPQLEQHGQRIKVLEKHTGISK